MIVVQPFDPSQMAAIERGIRLSDLGLNPAVDGKVMRVPIPSLTEERRKELSRTCTSRPRKGATRFGRCGATPTIASRSFLKEHKISEDDERKGLDQIQKATDEHIKSIDDLQRRRKDARAGSLIAERDAERAGREQQVVVERVRSSSSPPLPRSTPAPMSGGVVGHHLPELPALQQLHRLAAEARRQGSGRNAGGLAAPLEMAEHDVAGFLVRELRQQVRGTPARRRPDARHGPPCAASTIE
jgi:hypothetical protein